jgi:hypothetical protein
MPYKEGAAVKTIGALVDQYGDWHLVANSIRNGARVMVGLGRSWPLLKDG